MKLALTMFRTERWFGEDIFRSLDLIDIADRKGIDLLSLPDHVAMGKDISAYPYTRGLFTAETDFLEPLVLAAVIAARTRRIRFATNVMIAPLRPAVLLAKQVATLDVLSGGRIDLGVGVGWQKAEYDFEGLSWEGRFGRLMEIVEACRVLWSQAPASFHGKHIDFEGAYSRPFPVQRGGVPILLGLAPTDLGIERLVKHADGWCPLSLSLDEVGAAMAKLRERARTVGRDLTGFRLRLPAPVVKVNGTRDLEASIAELPKLKALGCTEVNFSPLTFCNGPEEFERFVDRLIVARDTLG